MRILGIETSCDETAASVVEDGRQVCSNAIASQVPLHRRWGGVVPEIASRAHLEAIIPIVAEALGQAGVTLSGIDAIAVTRGPGLIGCLLIGVETAKGIAESRGVPFVCVQHIAGHLYSPYLCKGDTDAWGDAASSPRFEPYLALVISGGHSSLVRVDPPLGFSTLGETLDDAVGEAYDKCAKLLGLGYPGGPVMDRLATEGDPKSFRFPRPLVNRAGFDFSFSGLKSSLARAVEKLGGPEAVAAQTSTLANLAASFQSAAIETLLERTGDALKETGLRRLALTGGVACNRGLRAAVRERFPRIEIAIPEPEYCTDNAAMIAGVALHAAIAGQRADRTINASPSLALAGGWQE